MPIHYLGETDKMLCCGTIIFETAERYNAHALLRRVAVQLSLKLQKGIMPMPCSDETRWMLCCGTVLSETMARYNVLTLLR